MQLGNQVEWALHCCAILASLPDGVTVNAQTLAEFHGVPKPYLAKALQRLADHGVVETSLGPRGGYRLARPPGEITFLDIVEAVEGERRSFICTEIRKRNPCGYDDSSPSPPCTIARVMYRADAAWRKELGSVTLADHHKDLMAALPIETVERDGEWLRRRCLK